MKKLLTILLAVLMIIALAGCSGNGKEEGGEGEPKDATITIGYSLNSMDATMKTMADYFEAEAKARGWEPVLLNANGDVGKELENMESLMNMGASAVVIMGCDTDGSGAAINEVGAAGIPVIIAGRPLNAENYYTFVTGDHKDAGKAQAAYLNGLLEADPNLTLNVAFIYGQSGSSSVAQRYEGFEEDGLNGTYKDRYNLVASQYAEFDTQKAYDITTDMLTTYPEINCFVTQSDEQASGIINAIKAKNLPVEDFIIVSIDCSTTGQTYLASGELDATVLMAMKQLAISSADYVQKALDGATVEKKNPVENYYKLVTPETYEQVLVDSGMEVSVKRP